MVGRTISHYRVVEELGRGGMGIVYRGEDTRLRRPVALKLLPPDLAADEDRIDRFRQEARTLANLEHPCIVTVYGVEETDGQLVLAMELVDGRTLAEIIPRGGLDLSRYFRIAVPLTDALSVAHDRGVVHRDLKPSNVMVTEDGHVKVLDFGLAKLAAPPDEAGRSFLTTASPTAEGVLAGTAPYMSPEQLHGDPVDARSDIFSLGIILFEMAVGRHPFEGRSSADLVSSILRDTPTSVTDLRAGLPRHLARIVQGCMEKDRERRFQSAKDVRNQLEGLERELSSPELERAPLPGRRGRLRLAVAAAAAALVLVAALAAWLLLGRPPPAEPAAPAYLGVREHALLPGQRDPEARRSGLIDALRERLTGLEGVYLTADEHGPQPDLVLQVDARATGDELLVRFRLTDGDESQRLGEALVEGGAAAPFELLDDVGRAVARVVGAEAGVAAQYRAPPVPTDDAEAFELYLRGRDHLRPADDVADPAAALEFFGQALSRDPGFFSARVYEGRAALHRYRDTRDPVWLDRARAACRQAAETEPGWAPAHTCLGDVLRVLARPLDAAQEYLRAIEANAEELAAYSGLRAAYDDLGLPAPAEAAWKRVIELHPDFWAGYFELGGYYYEIEDHLAAIEQFEAALELAPANFTVYYALGGVQLIVGRYGEAVTSLEESIKIRPDYRAFSTLGYAYFLLRRYADAVRVLERAVGFESANYLSWGQLGVTYHFAPGRTSDSAAALERAIAMGTAHLAEHPVDSGAMLNLAYYHAMRGDREASLAALGGALERRPDDAHYAYREGLVYNVLGDREEALKRLERAVAGGYPLHEIRITPELDNLREEPRLRQLLGTS